MQVRHALLPILAAVDDNAITGLVHLQLFDELADHAVCVADDGFVLLCQLVDADDVFLRHHEHMHGRLRLDVVERDNNLVLIHFAGGDFSCDDFTKDAVAHFLNSFVLV